MRTSFCHFDVFLRGSDGKPHRTAVLFTAAKTIKPRHASEDLKRIFADAYAPSQTIFIGLNDARDELRRLIDSDEMNHVHLPIEREKIQIYVFGNNGRLLHADDSGNHVELWHEDAIRRQGMTAIFARRGGLMHAGASYHYVKPSGGHSVRFLRPGNVMRQGAEVAFIATWLLRYFTKHTPAIYADTASITQVAYAATAMAQRLAICETEPVIQSFGSYSGLENADSFGVELDALVLISASTSGNMKDRIALQSGADPAKIITLFSTAGKDGLCELLHDSDANPNGIEKVVTHERAECPECAAGSLPIKIAGDSFLPETPEPRLKLIKRTDQPKWHERIIKAIEKKRVAQCFRPALMENGRDYPLFCDISSLCTGASYAELFELPLSRLLNLGVDVIIRLPDPASETIARKAQKKYSSVASFRPKMLVADDRLDKNLKALRQKKGRLLSVIVVASCVAGGFTLQSISRSLRNPADRVGYFIAFAVPPSAGAWAQMRSNLEKRNDGRGKNPVEVVWQASLPQFGFGQACPWKKESDWLQEHKNAISSKLFKKRLKILENADAERQGGLVDNAFLPSPTGKALELAQNFAFHRCDKAALTQADVFLIVSSMLHHLRDPSQKDGLRQSMNSHVLLDPDNFDRYNDSVLQAALLRAAQASELGYGTHATASRSMAGLIERMIRLHDQIEGEALPEFLLALVTRRMSLTPNDLKLLTSRLKENLDTHHYLSTFLPTLEELIK